MQPLTRWKLACAVLAAVTTFEFLTGDEAARPVPTASRGRSADVSGAFRPTVATSRSDIDAIVRRLRATRSSAETRSLAQQLGVIGDDRAIDDVRGLVVERRPPAPMFVIQAIGTIGTDHAVDVLVDLVDDNGLRSNALDGLGQTHNPKAEPVLERIARTGEISAITALGELGTEHSVAILSDLGMQVADIGKYAIAALGESTHPDAVGALAKLIDSPNTEVAAAAIAALPELDDAMFQKLSGIVQSGEPGLLEPAIAALAHAGERALPMLRELATKSNSTGRAAAVHALAQLRSDDAYAVLNGIIETADYDTVRAAIDALWEVDTQSAREQIISAALGERRSFNGAIDTLMRMRGPDVDQALLSLAKIDRDHRFQVLGHLVDIGNTDALQIVNDLVKRGSDVERKQALAVFGEGGSDAAAKALMALVRGQTGETQHEAISLLAKHASNPEVAKLLRDRLEQGTPEEAIAAAGALASAGTAEARDALIAALSNGDDDLTRIALGSLAQFRLTDDMSNALFAAAHANPDLVREVMLRLVTENSPRGMELARGAIASNDPDQVREALYALQRSAAPEAIKLIEGTLGSRDDEIRVRAIQSLGNMRAAGAEETIVAALRDSSDGVRQAAMQALGSLGTDRAKASLLEIARTGSASDKQTVIATMQYNEGPAVNEMLSTMIHDSDPMVAIVAIDGALGRGMNLDAELGAMAANRSLPIEVRQRAYVQLRGTGMISPAVEKELGEVVVEPYHMLPSPDEGGWDGLE